jgi:uncharacterized protein YlxP (DUF503 family)
MVIGILQIDLILHDSQSLKDKRIVLKSLKTRLHNNFNVAISELDHQEKWQKALLGIASIGNEKKAIDTMLANIVNFINREKSVEISDYTTELL